MPGKRPRWTAEALRIAVAEGRSMADVMRAIGLRPVGGNHGTIARAIARLALDTAHFHGAGWRRGSTTAVVPARPLDELLVRNGPNADRRDLKRRLLPAGRLTYACAGCGVSEWRGTSLALELDHVDGDDADNRLENLRLPCPNCHSQTDTYRGRNIGKKPWRVREQPGWRNWSTLPT